jgi:error-prone DNA polymerase
MYPRRLILDEARQMGITISPIDINYSDRTYRVENISDSQKAIRISLADVQGISDAEIDSILINRPYLDLADFVYRSGSSSPTTQALLLLGAFDNLNRDQNIHRRDLLMHLYDLDKYSQKNKKSGQLALQLAPSDLEVSGLPDLTNSERIRHEVKLTGMDISHHMLEFYGDFLNSIGAVRSSDLLNQRSGATVLVAGVKVALQTPPVRSGRRVMFLTLDDGYGCNDITFFEDAQDGHAALLRESWLFLVRGVVRKTGVRGISLRALSAWDLGESYSRWRSLSQVTTTEERSAL